MAPHICIKIHGVRAIHPAPSRKNMTTGGNTSCIELTDGSHRIFVNAGFGLTAAGSKWLDARRMSKDIFHGAIVFADFMWDSMMGLPFFAPMHFKSSSIHILTCGSITEATQALNEISSKRVSVFDGLGSFPAKITLSQVSSSETFGNWTILGCPLPHPLSNDCVGIWRFVHQGGADIGVVLTCNNDDASITKASAFLNGCKTLICAASESPFQDQWDKYRTTSDDALKLALLTSAQELHLTQFHPGMSDGMLQATLARLRSSASQLVREGNTHLKIHLGSELDEFRPAQALPQSKAG